MTIEHKMSEVTYTQNNVRAHQEDVGNVSSKNLTRISQKRTFPTPITVK